jgi:hypothetical protein
MFEPSNQPLLLFARTKLQKLKKIHVFLNLVMQFDIKRLMQCDLN